VRGFRIRSNDSADSDQVMNRGEITGRSAEAHRQSPPWIASANACGSSGGTRMRHELSPISEIPPTWLATNGVPQANDSLRTLGKPSDRL